MGYWHWTRRRARGATYCALFQRDQQRWPHCTVRIAHAGIWIAYGETVWTIPWQSVAEALSGPAWWGMRLHSGEFIGFYWEDDMPSLAAWWP